MCPFRFSIKEKVFAFVIILFFSMLANAVTRWPPLEDGGTCSADKPLGQWEYCKENEPNCVQEGAGLWKWVCYACDTEKEVNLRINEERCRLCPNRYLNAKGNCVIDSLSSHWQDFLYVYDEAYRCNFGWLSAIFAFPMIFMLAKIFPKKKWKAFLCWCAFIGITMVAYFMPLIIGTWLMVPYCLWIFVRDLGRLIYNAGHIKKENGGQKLKLLCVIIMAILFVVLGVVDMALFIPALLMTISLYTTFVINKQLKVKGKK